MNLAGGSVGAYIGSGVTVATFTNAVAGVVTPTSGGGGGGGGAPAGGGGAPAGGGTPVRHDFGRHRVGRHCRDDVVDCQHDRRLCSEGCQGREEGLGRQGADRLPEVRPLRRRPRQRCDETARIKVTLLGKQNKVLKVAFRTVLTNRAAKVTNLKLGPSVRSVKVAIA